MNIPAAIEQIIIQFLHDYGAEADISTQDCKLGDSLGMDELDVIEVIHRAEKKFGIQIPDDAITEGSRVSELSELVADLLNEKAAREARSPTVKAAWNDYPDDAA